MNFVALLLSEQNWNWLIGPQTGVIAVVGAVLAVLVSVATILKLLAENRKLRVDVVTASAAARKLTAESVQLELADIRSEHNKIFACVKVIDDSASLLFNELCDTYDPLLLESGKMSKQKWSETRRAVNDFKFKRKYRPMLEAAIAELAVFAERTEDLKIDELKPKIDELEQRAREFCNEVTGENSFIDPIESCNGHMNADLVQAIKSWKDRVCECERKLPPLAGSILPGLRLAGGVWKGGGIEIKTASAG